VFKKPVWYPSEVICGSLMSQDSDITHTHTHTYNVMSSAYRFKCNMHRLYTE